MKVICVCVTVMRSAGGNAFDFGEKSDLFDRFNEIHPNRFKSDLTNHINMWFISVILYHQYVQRAFKLPTKNT